MRAHTFRPIARLALVGFLGLTTRAPAQPPGPLPSESMVTVRVESIRGGTADVHGVVAPDGGVLTSWRALMDSKSVVVLIGDQPEFHSRGVRALNSTSGLALLEVDWGEHRPPGIALAEHSPPVGSRLRVLMPVKEGMPADPRSAEVRGVESVALLFRIDLRSSDSPDVAGLPLVAEDGTVVGIIHGFSASLSLGIPPTGALNIRAVRSEVIAAICPGELIEWDRFREVAAACEKSRAIVDDCSQQLFARRKSAADIVDPLRKATELDPGNAEAWRALARALEACRDYEQAAAAARQHITLVPTDPDAFETLALSESRLGRNEPALRSIQRAIELDPNRAHDYVLKASLLRLTGRALDAIELLQDRIRIDPNDGAARDLLIEFLEARGRHAEAQDLADRRPAK